MGVTVKVPLEDLTDRQLHIYLLSRLHLLEEVHASQIRIEAHMADLSQSVSELTSAVDAIGVRFQEVVQPLHQALADAQKALADEELDDAAKDQALADALAAAEAAGSEIQAQVAELNQIGTPVEVPSEPDPDAPVVEPEPVE
jgi:peptidoglycan hydrolase CwlO-like protein